MNGIVAKISESGKTAVVMVKTSPFSMNRTPVYIPNQNYKPKQELQLPQDAKIVDWVGHSTKDGIPLKTLG
jgi:hypothetical protein